MAIISELKAKNIKPDSGVIPHGGITGLTLQPTKKKGHGKWVLRFVSPVTGKRRNAGLGSYPEISIVEAGRIAQEMRVSLEKGLDPIEERNKEKAVVKRENQQPIFSEAAYTLYETLKPSWKNAKHQQQWINTLKQYAFPVIGRMKLKDIEPNHIAKVLQPIWLDKVETATRVKQRMHAVMAWGWANQYCQSNPVDVVSMLLPTQPSKSVHAKHFPAMPWQSIPEFISTELQPKKGYNPTQSLLLFLILTASRSGEARGVSWSEIDWETHTWIVPATRMKMKLQHRVPLSKQAISILEGMKGLHKDLVFPSPRKQNILSDMALTSFLRKHNAPSDSEGRVATAHGFRSSFRDWCSEHGYPRDWAERALAHTIANKVEAAYHRTDLLEQRREMMQAWADYLYQTKGKALAKEATEPPKAD